MAMKYLGAALLIATCLCSHPADADTLASRIRDFNKLVTFLKSKTNPTSGYSWFVDLMMQAHTAGPGTPSVLDAVNGTVQSGQSFTLFAPYNKAYDPPLGYRSSSKNLQSHFVQSKYTFKDLKAMALPSPLFRLYAVPFNLAVTGASEIRCYLHPEYLTANFKTSAVYSTKQFIVYRIDDAAHGPF